MSPLGRQRRCVNVVEPARHSLSRILTALVPSTTHKYDAQTLFLTRPRILVMRPRLIPVAIALIAPMMVSACSRSAPSAPSATAPTPQPNGGPTLSSFHLSGVARDDDGQPVSAVRVDVHPWVGGLSGPVVSTLTDAGGAYAVDFNAIPDAVGAIGGVLTDKVGYEPDDRGFIKPSGSRTVQDLHIYRIRRIVAGESTHIVVGPDDPHCGVDDEWVCRTVRVASSSSSLMTIELVADSGPTPKSGLEIFEPSYSCCASRQTISIGPGVERIVHVLMWWQATASEGYTVHTSLAP
jgi:hypothetical protein